MDKVKCFNNVGMMQRGSDAEFGRYFLDIFTFSFVLKSLAKLLDCKRLVIRSTLDQPYGATGAFANVTA